MKLTAQKIKEFKIKVYQAGQVGYRVFPWRQTKNPYRILVSEIMLQQTQADRVVGKYREFTKKFPTVGALAKAPLGQVLQVWQGLGYNRRAKMLWQAARVIATQYRGRVPIDAAALEALPGIGPYTAKAVCAFAFNQPNVLIETNIRTVFIHEFFPRRRKVADAELLPLIELTLDQKNPRRWYTALMDYGAVLKRQHKNPSRRSAHHVRQSKFIGSSRQIRGAIIRELASGARLTKPQLLRRLPFASTRLQAVLVTLVTEGLIHKQGQQYFL